MNRPNRYFKLLDLILILFTILPLCFSVAIKVLFTPAAEGISITGAIVLFRIKTPIQELLITESQINSLNVVISVVFLCLYLTHGIRSGVWLKRHCIAELIVEKLQLMVSDSMGKGSEEFAPFIGAILLLSGFSSLLALVGLYAPTSDLNIVAGWAILVFIIITYSKLKGGLGQYIKGLANPPLMAPLNIIGELATPVSMAFRHYGNVLSGAVISVLVASGLQGLSKIMFGNLPGIWGEFPFLQIGLPAILSIYFDIFSGCLQAYIFAMLTMLYIKGT